MTTRLLRRSAHLTLALMCLVSAGCLAPREGPLLSVRFAEAEGLTVNPDCGWVAYDYEDGYAQCSAAADGQEPFPFASVVYARHARKDWQGPGGGFEGGEPLKLLEDWMAHGRHVGFRIYANGPEDLPPDLRDQVPTLSEAKERAQQAPGEGAAQGEGEGTEQKPQQGAPEGPGEGAEEVPEPAAQEETDGEPEDPKAEETEGEIVYWSEAYVEDHRKLVEFLGHRLGSSPYLAYVDIGGCGNTGGEWLFTPRDKFAEAGLDDRTHLRLVTEFVEMYRTAFPHARLFISYECIAKAWSQRRAMVDLLRANDVGLRDDGLGGWPFPEVNPSRATWPVSGLWPELPVLFEGGGEGGGVYGWTLQGMEPRQVLDWALEHACPSYVNIGGAETASARASEELPGLLREYGRRLGYRFVLLEATCPVTAAAGAPLPLDLVWANRGVAPCYADRPLELALFGEDGALAGTLLANPQPATGRWAPGQTVKVHAEFCLPADLPPGSYTLKLGMLRGDPRAPDAHVAIATDGADADGRFVLGVIRVK